MVFRLLTALFTGLSGSCCFIYRALIASALGLMGWLFSIRYMGFRLVVFCLLSLFLSTNGLMVLSLGSIACCSFCWVLFASPACPSMMFIHSLSLHKRPDWGQVNSKSSIEASKSRSTSQFSREVWGSGFFISVPSCRNRSLGTLCLGGSLVVL